MSTVRPDIGLSDLRNKKITWLAALSTGVVALAVAAAQFRSAGFLPHRFCYLLDPRLTWTHVTSDLLIGISYVSISATLLYLVRRTQGTIPYHWMVLAFGIFIVACGATHFMEVITIWQPLYWVAAAVKIVTAGASVTTAIALPFLCPTIIQRIDDANVSAERRQELEKANLELARLNSELNEWGSLKNALVAQQAANIGDWVWNMKSGENTWSEAVEVMHGLIPGTYDGRYESWWATVDPRDHEAVTAAIQRAIETGGYEVEYRTQRSDGSTYWTAARAKVIYDSKGKPDRMIGICMDVTGRKAQEHALLRAEKLAAAGRLAATVAHEINNPLEAVMNLLYLARSGGSDPDKLLAMAERELGRVSAIARQTLGFYRDTASPTDFRLAELIDQVAELYAGKLQGRRIEVRKFVEPDLVVHAPRGDLHQIVANLVSNAMDASAMDGVIEVHAVQKGGEIRIEITDQGIGLSPEAERRLFEPFFTTKRDVGTGLGLWVCKRLVEQMGGEIRYVGNGSSGHGARFSVTLKVLASKEAVA